MRTKNLLVYYGWLNSFNSATNGWDNEKVAQELSQYDVLVLGDGIQNTGHGDWSNTSVIVPRIKNLNPACEIYGYVSTNLVETTWKTKVNEWETNLSVHGIFMDESGYDYGSVSTNGRKVFNWKLDYIHSKDMKCFVNAWNPDHVLSTENDTSYANTTWNPNLLKSNLNTDDIYLLESFSYGPYGGGGALQYESNTQWKQRGDDIQAFKDQIRLAGLCQISDSDQNGQSVFDFTYISANMFDLDIYGSSDTLHGSSSSKSKCWTRPDLIRLVNNDLKIEVNGNVYLRYYTHGKLSLDFTTSSESSSKVFY